MDYPEGYTYIKAVGRRDQATEEDIYIYNEAVEGGQSKTEEGWKLWKNQGTEEDIHERYGRRGEQQEREDRRRYREGGRRKNTALTSTVTNRSNTFQGFLQKVLKLSIHLSTISTENMITVKLSMKFSNSLNTISP